MNKSWLALAVFVMTFAGFCVAQTGSATLSGRVTDPGGAILVGAEVVLTNMDTNAEARTRTNSSGLYVFTGIHPGRYRVAAGAPGFKVLIKEGLPLHTQDEVAENFALIVGTVSETMTVSADADQLPTNNPAVGLLVNRDFVENTPLNGRSFQDLIALAPGTVTSSTTGSNNVGLLSINGQHENSNYYTVDGVAANLNPSFVSQAQGTAGTLPSQTALGTTQSLLSVDALQEFKIETAGYAAEYGRQPGGQIGLITRSGTNDFHGSVFDYFRNEAMDANDWFANSQKIPRQAERQNDFGGTLGGPFRIPNLYNGKKKTFFFFSYEGLRIDLPMATGLQAVPSVTLRQFASPALQPFLNAYPLPNVPGHVANGDQCAATLDPNYPNISPNSPYGFSCSGEFAAGYSNPSRLDATSVRIDHNLGARVQLFGRYADTPSVVQAHFGGGFQSTNLNTHIWTLGATARLSPVLLDELRFNYSDSGGRQGSLPVPFRGSSPYPKTLLVPPEFSSANTPVFAGMFFFLPNEPSYYGDVSYNALSNFQHQYNLIDALEWNSGKHAFKFGVDYRRLSPIWTPPQYDAFFELLSISSVQNGSADVGVSLAQSIARPIFNNLSLYGQDSWKPLPRLALNYGVRWECNPAPNAADGRYPVALTTSNLANAQLAPPGTRQYRTRFNNFGPRFGFAYNALPNLAHGLAVRGGFGIFHDTGQAQSAAGYFNGGRPFFAVQTVQNVSLTTSSNYLTPPSLSIPLTPPYPTLSGVSDPNLRLPYAEEWNLSLDQALSAKNTLTVSYVGNNGKRILYTQEFPSLGSINPSFTDLFYTNNAASSSYNALQVQDQGYFAAGLHLLASYTWAHARDNSSSDYNVPTVPVWGNSDNDIRQVFNTAITFQVPMIGFSEVARSLTGGWSLHARFTADTGSPLNVIQGAYSIADGRIRTITPDLVRGVPVYLHDVPDVLGGWELNYAAFSQVPVDPTTGVPLQPGTLGRNILHGPGFWNLNMAAQRSFTVHESFNVVFRAEAFNILNHPNAGANGIDTFLPDGPGLFGKSNGIVQTIGVPNQLYATGGARSLQLTLKLQF